VGTFRRGAGADRCDFRAPDTLRSLAGDLLDLLPVRIAFVVHGYPPRETAGVELLTREPAEALAANGNEVVVFTRMTQPDAEEGSSHQETIGGVAVSWVVHNHPNRSPSEGESPSDRRIEESFAAWLARCRPQLIHVQHTITLSPNLVRVAHEAGIPTVLSLHDFYYLCHRIFLLDAAGERCPGPDAGARCVPCLAEHGLGSAVKQRFEVMARLLALPDALIAPSRALAARYVTELPFLDGRIEVIEPGLASVPRRREASRGADHNPSERCEDGPIRLLFVGTLLPHKAPDLLLSALRGLDAPRFSLDLYGADVAGHEGYSGLLRELAQGMPVHFRGTFRPDRLAEVLEEEDVLVLPSRCDESYSRVVREARAAGLAVIAPRTGGPGDALRDGIDALLFEPCSAAELSGAVMRLLADPALRRALSDAQTEIATIADSTRRLEALYSRLLAAPGVPHAASGTTTGSVSGGRSRLPSDRVRVSVAYVTKNGAECLDGSLRAVGRQRGAFELCEIVAVDSGSSDGTIDLLARHGVRTIRIPPFEFGHGKTRNLAAREARGDVVVFLTQDATPADDVWLAALLDALASDPLLAGVWSRHLPRPGCHPMEWRMLSEFPLFQSEGLRVAAKRGNPDYAAHPEAYYWFSNNSSAIRKSVLERWPFPEIEFAEDQAWARAVLDAGWRTALVPRSRIYHSHAYSPWANLKRNFDHARAMRDDLGQSDDLTLADCLRFALRESRRDVAFWASYRRRTRLRVAARWGLPATAYHLGAFTGRWLGSRAHALPRTLAEQLSFQSGVRNAG